mmetsp:Transcript_1220/g.2894  ORF Transcript_1220/g.2894 Transcript_1220/m.2894 type:complete len:308 (+) Transcript_1220:2658-3581(+)
MSNVSTGRSLPSTRTSFLSRLTSYGAPSKLRSPTLSLFWLRSTTMKAPRRSKGATDFTTRLLPLGRWWSRALRGSHFRGSNDDGTRRGPFLMTSETGMLSKSGSTTPRARSQSLNSALSAVPSAILSPSSAGCTVNVRLDLSCSAAPTTISAAESTSSCFCTSSSGTSRHPSGVVAKGRGECTRTFLPVSSMNSTASPGCSAEGSLSGKLMSGPRLMIFEGGTVVPSIIRSRVPISSPSSSPRPRHRSQSSYSSLSWNPAVHPRELWFTRNLWGCEPNALRATSPSSTSCPSPSDSSASSGRSRCTS